MWLQAVAAIAALWYAIVLGVIIIGVTQIYLHYTRPSPKPVSSFLPLEAVPHVTIIRPVKGLEPQLYACLASTFQQNYPQSRLTVSFCVSSRHDAAIPTLKKLLLDFPSFDARVYIEDEDPNLNPHYGGRERNLGPNPKIRNMSRAYREAKGDIIWIVDCNVWVSASAAGLMVDLLCGFGPEAPLKITSGYAMISKRRKYKFVHQLPLAVDITNLPPYNEAVPASSSSPQPGQASVLSKGGGLLEELFHSTSHAKFYIAISTVAIAPCTVGKSNMFRRSHLDALTPPSLHLASGRKPGIDFFSDNICEDHLIGDLLWKTTVPQEVRRQADNEGILEDKRRPRVTTAKEQYRNTTKWGNHALLKAPPCIQPLDSTSVQTYAARRSRWLRVRKFTVPVATLVEPGTELLVAITIGTFTLTTREWCREHLGIPPTWTAFGIIWLASFAVWIVVDRWTWTMLQGWAGEGAEERDKVPAFVGSAAGSRGFGQWLAAWAGREVLAFPIWAWAVLGGTEVAWRGRRFKVGLDMRVHEVLDTKRHGTGKED